MKKFSSLVFNCSTVYWCLSLILLVANGCDTTDWVQNCGQQLIPSELLGNHLNFPTHWEGGEIAVQDIQWQINQTISVSSDSQFYALSSSRRIWNDQDSSRSSTPQILQEVFQYNSSIRATVQYYLSRPERAYLNKWPNFISSAEESNLYPTSWKHNSFYANQNYAVCAIDKPRSCQLWFFWARYNNYLLSLQLFAPNQGTAEDTFALVAHEIDNYIKRKCSR